MQGKRRAHWTRFWLVLKLSIRVSQQQISVYLCEKTMHIGLLQYCSTVVTWMQCQPQDWGTRFDNEKTHADFLHAISTASANLSTKLVAGAVEEQMEKTGMIFDGICNSSMFVESGCRKSLASD